MILSCNASGFFRCRPCPIQTSRSVEAAANLVRSIGGGRQDKHLPGGGRYPAASSSVLPRQGGKNEVTPPSHRLASGPPRPDGRGRLESPVPTITSHPHRPGAQFDEESCCFPPAVSGRMTPRPGITTAVAACGRPPWYMSDRSGRTRSGARRTSTVVVQVDPRHQLPVLS